MGEERVPMIYSAICGVMEDVGAVGKGDYNRQQNFKYRGVESVMNALNPAMIKHKVFCTPEVLEQNREERTTAKGANLIYSVCRMRYRFFATDGSFVDAVVVGEGMDSGDKATNKAMAVAFKYACFQTFCIPTESLVDDPDAETPDNSLKKGNAPRGNGSTGHGKPDAPQGGGTPPKGNAGQGNANAPQEDIPQRVRERTGLFNELAKELARTGFTWNAVAKTYKAEKVEDVTDLQLKDCLAKIRKQPDKVADKEKGK